MVVVLCLVLPQLLPYGCYVVASVATAVEDWWMPDDGPDLSLQTL